MNTCMYHSNDIQVILTLFKHCSYERMHAQNRSCGKQTSTISHILKRMRTAVDENFKEKLPWSAIKQDSVKVR